MKTKIVYGMIALLSVSLFFFGCDTGTGSDSSSSPNPTWPPTTGGGGSAPSDNQAAQYLATTLNGLATGASPVFATGNEIYIPNGTTVLIETAFAIPDGVKVVVLGNLTVDDADTDNTTEDAELLTITGTLEIGAGGAFALGSDNAEPLVVSNTGTLIAKGTFPVIDIINNGTLTLATGGTLDFAGASPPKNITHNGTLNVSGTGTAVILIGGTGVGTFTNPVGKEINVTDSGTIDITTDGLINAGTINVDSGNFNDSVGPLVNNGTINVADGIGAVAFTGGLTNNGRLNVAGDDTLAAGTIVITGALDNNGTIAINKEVTAITSITNTGTAGSPAVVTVGEYGVVSVAGNITNVGSTSIIVNGELATTSSGNLVAIADTTIEVGSTGTITLAGGLTNAGNLAVAADGTVTVTGAFVNTAATGKNVIVSGALTAPGTSFDNTDSKVTVDGGTLTFDSSAVATGATIGTIEVKNAGELINDTTTIVGTDAFELGANGVFTYTTAGYTVAGAVTFTAPTADNYTLPASTPVQVLANGILTIDTGAKLVLVGTSIITGVPTARLINTGAIDLNSTAPKYHPNGNPTPGAAVTNTTYDWKASVASGPAGWEATS